MLSEAALRFSVVETRQAGSYDHRGVRVSWPPGAVGASTAMCASGWHGPPQWATRIGLSEVVSMSRVAPPNTVPSDGCGHRLP